MRVRWLHRIDVVGDDPAVWELAGDGAEAVADFYDAATDFEPIAKISNSAPPGGVEIVLVSLGLTECPNRFPGFL